MAPQSVGGMSRGAAMATTASRETAISDGDVEGSGGWPFSQWVGCRQPVVMLAPR